MTFELQVRVEILRQMGGLTLTQPPTPNSSLRGSEPTGRGERQLKLIKEVYH